MRRTLFLLLSIGAGFLTLYSLTAVLRQDNSGTLWARDGAATYAIIDVGTLGGASSEAADINNKVAIVGVSAVSGGEELVSFLWQDGYMNPLPVHGSLSSQALAINDNGEIAGSAIISTGETAVEQPVLWNEDSFKKLPVPGEGPGTARAINNQGLIAGHTVTEGGNELLLWQGESLSQTIPIEGGRGWVNGLNDAGNLVGHITGEQGNSIAFLWQDGAFTNLGALGGSSARANAINDALQIVGSAAISDDLSSRAFLWENGVMQDLVGLGEDEVNSSQANDINNQGLIVGQAQVDGEQHAVLWQDGHIVDLNILLALDSDWEILLTAESINDNGWIAGTGLVNGNKRTFLLKPLPLTRSHFLPFIISGKATATPTATATLTPTITPTATPTMTPSPTATPIPQKAVDLTRFLIGDSRLYEVQHSIGSQARHQTQIDDENEKRFFHTKGNEISAEWEELWATRSLIYRGTDTSPGNGEYYSLYEGDTLGSPWSPRYWKVGDIYERNPYVVFYRKSDCQIVASGFHHTWLRFEKNYDSYTFESGITLDNVVKFAWLLHPDGQPIENYFYAEDYGLVGWGSNDRGYSYISEEHGPGQRPDNKREVIPCLSKVDETLIDSPELNFGPLPEPYAIRVR